MKKEAKTKKIRCSWVNSKNSLYIHYHDHEWGVEKHDDIELFEMLILEGAQAGLSWETVLNKRINYRNAFDNFDPKIVSKYDEQKYDELLQDKGIIRNRLKIKSAIRNAKVFINIQNEFGSFDSYIWDFVKRKPIINSFTKEKAPTTTELSDKISKDLKNKGMNFVGSTIIYAFMQSVGMVNDHEINCYKHIR